MPQIRIADPRVLDIAVIVRGEIELLELEASPPPAASDATALIDALEVALEDSEGDEKYVAVELELALDVAVCMASAAVVDDAVEVAEDDIDAACAE
jgi:hypothetical protein